MLGVWDLKKLLMYDLIITFAAYYNFTDAKEGTFVCIGKLPAWNLAIDDFGLYCI